MTPNIIDDIMKRILNDPDIYYMSPIVFNTIEWNNLSKDFHSNNIDKFNQIVNNKIQTFDQNNHKNKRAIKLTRSLQNAVTSKPYILQQIFSTLDKFGPIRCNLPTMEDFGKVIENHNRSTVEQYFFYKIDKERDRHRKRGLKKTLEYLKELYTKNIDNLEIAFFIRKLDSLNQFIEVIQDE